MKRYFTNSLFPCLFAVVPFLSPMAMAAEVQWADVVNASAEGNSLVKTSGCDGCEDAGAHSQQQLDSGNVYVEFTVPDTSEVLYAGINNAYESGTSAQEIDFAVRTQDGIAEVRENGAYKAGTEAGNGDVFRISVNDGLVSYFRNGMAFYTSDQRPQYPLVFDTSLLSEGARLEDVVAVPFGEQSQNQTAFLGAQAPSNGQTVQINWTDLVDTQVLGDNTLIKTAGCDGCVAGARSERSLESGNVYIEFTIPDVSKLHWVGLTNEPTRLDDEVLDYAIRVQSGNAEIRENGAYQGGTQVSNGDKFRISLENGTVSYYRNGENFYTSSKPVEYPLYLGALLADEGAAVANAVAVPFGDQGLALQ